MAANPTPTNDHHLLVRCHDMAGGCEALEVELGIKQNTAAKMRAGAETARAAMAEVGRLKGELGLRRKEFREVDREGERVLGRCRLRLAALFGPRHNMHWEAAGFRHRTTMVPESLAGRQALLTGLAGYLTLFPEKESTDMGTTAVICAATHDAVQAARTAVRRCQTQLRVAVLAKRAALKKLRKQVRGLIRELDIVMTKDDPRWQRFGLRVPAALSMPKAVEGVTLTALGGGAVEVKWPLARHARRYRVQVRRAGAAEFENVKTLRGRETTLTGLPVGEDLEVRVIAANKLDEAAPSPVAAVRVL
jgi:ribosomal protein S28E/S33